MKVVGTGSPLALTLRLREREIKGLSEELEQRCRVADDAVQTALDGGRDLSSVRDAGRTPAEIGVAVVAMQDVIARASANAEGRYVVTGPTWLLGPTIRGASIEASERLVEVLRRFADGGSDAPPSEELRDAVGDAAAWSETLMGLEHAERFGVDG